MEEEGLVTCPEPPPPFVTIVEDGFGFVTDENSCRHIIRRYTFTNQNNLIVQVINYGATVTSIKYPDKNGILDDVVLGYDNIEGEGLGCKIQLNNLSTRLIISLLLGYLTSSNPYFGATVGRVANRIAKGHFKIGDEDYQLSTNNGQHHLHGGFKGFDKV